MASMINQEKKKPINKVLEDVGERQKKTLSLGRYPTRYI